MSFGMQRDEFDAIMYNFKKRYSRHVKREFNPDEIRALALAYRNALRGNNIEFSDSPKEQLFTAISQVEASWHSPKAKAYREIMGLSEDWGTAVAIQAMVFGNLYERSGAGVMFTHNPWTSEDQVEVVGDFTMGNQGEDVVGGLVKTLPLSEKQRLGEREHREYSLEMMFPKVYQRLVKIAKDLVYGQNWAPQEVEFTFQGDREEDVYVLQSRNMAPRVKRYYPAFMPSESLQAGYLGSGIGVSGGALSGLVAFDLESIRRLRKERPDQAIILLRSDTVPDDIREISIADGILTGKGGATSHAAIVAHRLGKTCVVGFSKMRVWEADRRCVIDGHILQTGDIIGIDGHSGAIYRGHHETQQVELPN
jgi:pyruvate,orthophosphate dikinase